MQPTHLEKELLITAKEPYVTATKAGISANEPYITAKEPCISAKEPDITTKEPCISAKESYITAKYSYVSAKEPYINAPSRFLRQFVVGSWKRKKTATHCSTLQHMQPAATHCNTLQHLEDLGVKATHGRLLHGLNIRVADCWHNFFQLFGGGGL